MLDPQHPVVLELQRFGFKVTAQAYFRNDKVALCATAYHPKTKRLFHGRSRQGNLEEALEELAYATDLEDAASVDTI